MRSNGLAKSITLRSSLARWMYRQTPSPSAPAMGRRGWPSRCSRGNFEATQRTTWRRYPAPRLAHTPTGRLAPMAVTLWAGSGFKLNSMRARLACELGALVYQADLFIVRAGKPRSNRWPPIPITSETSTPCCSGQPPGGSTRRWRRWSGRRRWKIASTGLGC